MREHWGKVLQACLKRCVRMKLACGPGSHKLVDATERNMLQPHSTTEYVRSHGGDTSFIVHHCRSIAFVRMVVILLQPAPDKGFKYGDAICGPCEKIFIAKHQLTFFFHFLRSIFATLKERSRSGGANRASMSN